MYETDQYGRTYETRTRLVGLQPVSDDARWERFGDAIRLLRKGVRFTMIDVAKRLGVPAAAVSALELGEKRG